MAPASKGTLLNIHYDYYLTYCLYALRSINSANFTLYLPILVLNEVICEYKNWMGNVKNKNESYFIVSFPLVSLSVPITFCSKQPISELEFHYLLVSVLEYNWLCIGCGVNSILELMGNFGIAYLNKIELELINLDVWLQQN